MNQVRLQNAIGRTSLLGQIVKLAPGSTKAYILANTPDPDAIGTVAESVPNRYWGLVNLINTVADNDVENPFSRTVYTSTTELDTDHSIVINSLYTSYVYLLDATGSNRVREIINIGVGDIIVVPAGDPSDPSSLDRIDDETTQTVSQWECMVIKDIATNFWKII